MYIDAHTIITAGSVLAAATAIFALVFKIYRWVLKQDKQDAEIKRVVYQMAGRHADAGHSRPPFVAG